MLFHSELDYALATIVSWGVIAKFIHSCLTMDSDEAIAQRRVIEKAKEEAKRKNANN